LQGSGVAAANYASVADLVPYEISESINATAASPNTQTNSWISPHVPLLSLAFDKYAMVSLAFHYEPQATAIVSDRLVCAWTDDPSHPFLSASGAAAAATVPSQLQLLVTKDSVAFMPWKSWTLRVPVSKDTRFMYSTAAEDSGGTDASPDRFYSFGSLSCVGSAAPATSIVYGILYVSLVMDLFDPVPIVSSVNALVEALHAARRHHKRPIRRFKSVAAPTPPPGGPSVETKSSTGKRFAVHSDGSAVADDEDWNSPLEPPLLVRQLGLASGRPAPLVPPTPSSSTSSNSTTARR